MKKPDKTLLKIRDVWGRTHYVRKEYYENPKRVLLGCYRKDGVPLEHTRSKYAAIHRENIAGVVSTPKHALLKKAREAGKIAAEGRRPLSAMSDPSGRELMQKAQNSGASAVAEVARAWRAGYRAEAGAVTA